MLVSDAAFVKNPRWHYTFLIMFHFLEPQRQFRAPQNPFVKANYILLFDKNFTKIHWTKRLRLVFEACNEEGGMAARLAQGVLSQNPIYNFFSNILTMAWPQILNYCIYCDPRDGLVYLIRVQEFPSIKFIFRNYLSQFCS